MSAYSKRVSFYCDFDRYRDRESGEILRFSQIEEDDGFEQDLEVLSLKIEGSVHYYPGMDNDNLGDRAPGEEYIEIISITDLEGNNCDNLIDESERSQIICMIDDEVYKHYYSCNSRNG